MIIIIKIIIIIYFKRIIFSTYASLTYGPQFTNNDMLLRNEHTSKELLCHLMGKACSKCQNRQKIYVYENVVTPMGCLPLPLGYIHC